MTEPEAVRSWVEVPLERTSRLDSTEVRPSPWRLLIGPVLAVCVAIPAWWADRFVVATALVGSAVITGHLIVLSEGFRRGLARASARIGVLVGEAVGTAGLFLAFALVVAPLGLLMRGLGLRPLEPGPAPRSGESAWLRLSRAPRHLWDRPFGDERSWRPSSGGPGDRRATIVRTVLAVLVVQAVLAGFVVAMDRRTTPRPELAGASSASPRESAALRDAPGGELLFRELGQVSQGLVYAPFTGSALRDFEGRYVNVADRVRRSYQPTIGPDDEPIDIWFFGGSTMFGFDAQRDMHTIPSEFARLAEAAGLPVRVRNYGSPGFVGYQEAVLLSLLVTAGQQPDLVVFYDGINDTSLQLLNAVGGLNPLGEPADLGSWQTRSALVEVGVIPGGSAEAPGRLVPRETSRPVTADDIVDAVHDVYAQTMALAASLADQVDFDVVHLWQPDIYSRTPLHPAEASLLEGLSFDRGRFDAMAALSRKVRLGLPDGVIDISDALDDLDQPVLADNVHINEVGASAVALAMYRELEPRLRDLVEG